MRKIIKGKLYDTNTSELMAHWDDDNHRVQDLFRKRTGEYYLYCAEPWQGQEIIPLSYADAEAWADQHLTPELYNAIFGPLPIDNASQRLTLNLTADTIAALKRESSRTGRTISQIIQELIEQIGLRA